MLDRIERMSERKIKLIITIFEETSTGNKWIRNEEHQNGRASMQERETKNKQKKNNKNLEDEKKARDFFKSL